MIAGLMPFCYSRRAELRMTIAHRGVRVFCLLLLLASTSWPQKKSPAKSAPSLALDAKVCRPASSEQKKWFGSEFADFEKYEIACPVQTHSGPVVLYILSVNGYDISQARSPQSPEPRLPKALIVKPQGETVGTLPYAFPFEAPVSLDLKFVHWCRGFPHMIELYLEDPAVGGNKKLPPLKWDAKQGRYLETENSNGR